MGQNRKTDTFLTELQVHRGALHLKIASISDRKVSPSDFSGEIPMSELKATYSCSSGPGGQNVNKVATKVDLRLESWYLYEMVTQNMLRTHEGKSVF